MKTDAGLARRVGPGKLPAARRGVNLLALLALALLLAGCLVRPPRTVRELPPGEWTTTLGMDTRAPFAAETVPAAPREVWRRGFERGQVSTPLVHGSLLVLGSTGRVLSVASARDGGLYWRRRFDGPVAGSPLRVGDVLLVATASQAGRVLALSLDRGRRQWETRLRSPITLEPVYDGGRIFVGTVRQELVALSSTDGSVAWRVRVPGQPTGAPVLHEGALIVGTQRDTLLRVRTVDGGRDAAAALPGAVSAPLALVDGRVIVPAHPGGVHAYDARTLQPVWSVDLGAPVLAAPAVDADGTIYALARTGEVWRIGADGTALRLVALDASARESLTLTRDGLLVGLLDGTLVMLGKDGSIRWREQYRSSLRSPVAVRAGTLYVALLNGTVTALQ